jgi:hypothetical protein
MLSDGFFTISQCRREFEFTIIYVKDFCNDGVKAHFWRERSIYIPIAGAQDDYGEMESYF